jgi:hypothetical protein
MPASFSIQPSRRGRRTSPETGSPPGVCGFSTRWIRPTAAFLLCTSFVSALTCYRLHRGLGIAAATWAALVGVSALFTKQHYVVDVIAGVLLALAAYVLLLRRYSPEGVAESERRRAPVRALGVVGIYGVMIAGFWVAYLLGAQP